MNVGAVWSEGYKVLRVLTVSWFDAATPKAKAKGKHDISVVIRLAGTGGEHGADADYRYYVDHDIFVPVDCVDWLIGELQRVKGEVGVIEVSMREVE